MVWVSPTYMDLWPGATEAEAREWWEEFRELQNDFAERFNNDWINRIFFWFGKGHPIDMVPSYDELMAEWKGGTPKPKEDATHS